jgi:hypothetical protein
MQNAEALPYPLAKSSLPKVTKEVEGHDNRDGEKE